MFSHILVQNNVNTSSTGRWFILSCGNADLNLTLSNDVQRFFCYEEVCNNEDFTEDKSWSTKVIIAFIIMGILALIFMIFCGCKFMLYTS